MLSYMISREKTSIRKYKKRETLSLSISLPAQRILLKIWEMFSNAINNTLLKNKNFRRWSRKNWSFLNGMTQTFFFFWFDLVWFGFLTKIRANPNQIIELKNFSNPNQIFEYFGFDLIWFDFFKSNTLVTVFYNGILSTYGSHTD